MLLPRRELAVIRNFRLFRPMIGTAGLKDAAAAASAIRIHLLIVPGEALLRIELWRGSGLRGHCSHARSGSACH